MTKRVFPIKWLTFIGLLVLALAACGPATPVAEEATTDDESANAEETQAEDTSAEAEPAEPAAGEAAETQPEAPSDFDLLGGASEDDVITTDTGLRYIVFEEGDGEQPDLGQVVMVHYTGYLEDGTVFDSSVERGQPFGFPIGQGLVIPGWDEGIALLNAGSRARLIIPSDLGYGDVGAGDAIPPGATLVFDVELVEIREGAPESPEDIAEADYTETADGLLYYDLVEGDGASPEEGQQVLIHFTGWLADGTGLSSSLDRGQPVPFVYGVGQVIPGWDVGVTGMKEGGMRQMIIPPELAFGETGTDDGIIPPNASLIFQIELVDVAGN